MHKSRPPVFDSSNSYQHSLMSKCRAVTADIPKKNQLKPAWHSYATKVAHKANPDRSTLQSKCLGVKGGGYSTIEIVFPQLPYININNLPQYPSHSLSFYHTVWIMCSAITTDVSVGTALNIPWWTLCISSALISLTAGVSRLNYPDMDKGSKNGKLGGRSLLI